MSELAAGKAEYGNWVSMKFVYVPGAVGVVLLGLSLLSPLALIGAVPCLLVAAYFIYARIQFSASGGNVQGLIQEAVLDRLQWDGEGQALDIGCGNAPLTIKLAHDYPQAQVVGIDYWDGMWEFSQRSCEQNAVCEGVGDRVTFQKASASALPFLDESFDAVVSNMVFHEVADTLDKREVLREALRVVKKGGAFSFQDLFLIERTYGDIDDLLQTIKSWGIERVKLVDTSHSDFIPRALRLPFMVGTISIIYGKK